MLRALQSACGFARLFAALIQHEMLSTSSEIFWEALFAGAGGGFFCAMAVPWVAHAWSLSCPPPHRPCVGFSGVVCDGGSAAAGKQRFFAVLPPAAQMMLKVG